MKRISEVIEYLEQIKRNEGDLLAAIDGNIYDMNFSVEKAGDVCDETNLNFGISSDTKIVNIE